MHGVFLNAEDESLANLQKERRGVGGRLFKGQEEETNTQSVVHIGNHYSKSIRLFQSAQLTKGSSVARFPLK